MRESKSLILIVDDDPQDIAPMLGALSRSGYAYARLVTDLVPVWRHIAQEHAGVIGAEL